MSRSRNVECYCVTVVVHVPDPGPCSGCLIDLLILLRVEATCVHRMINFGFICFYPGLRAKKMSFIETLKSN